MAGLGAAPRQYINKHLRAKKNDSPAYKLCADAVLLAQLCKKGAAPPQLPPRLSPPPPLDNVNATVV